MHLSDYPVDVDICTPFVPSEDYFRAFTKQMFEDHFLRKIKYGAEAESLYAVVFEFGDGIESPPGDTYEERGDREKIVSKDEKVTKLEFETFKYDGH